MNRTLHSWTSFYYWRLSVETGFFLLGEYQVYRGAQCPVGVDSWRPLPQAGEESAMAIESVPKRGCWGQWRSLAESSEVLVPGEGRQEGVVDRHWLFWRQQVWQAGRSPPTSFSIYLPWLEDEAGEAGLWFTCGDLEWSVKR